MRRLGTVHATDNYKVYEDEGNYYLKSYNSWVAKLSSDGVFSLGKDWDYSATTKRHVQWFIDEFTPWMWNTEMLRNKINSGIIDVEDVSPDSSDASIYRIR